MRLRACRPNACDDRSCGRSLESCALAQLAREHSSLRHQKQDMRKPHRRRLKNAEHRRETTVRETENRDMHKRQTQIHEREKQGEIKVERVKAKLHLHRNAPHCPPQAYTKFPGQWSFQAQRDTIKRDKLKFFLNKNSMCTNRICTN